MGKKRKHFPGTGDCLMHTGRSKPSCDQFPGCDYQNVGTKLSYFPQASHHVIPVSALVAYKNESKYRGYVSEINTVYKDTKYCSNQEANVMWLPKKPTYSKQKKTAAGWPPVWNLNLPCHDWDHPRYTEEVKEALRSRIWDKFKDPTQPCPDPPTIQIQFDAVEKDFKKKLKDRGTREYSGTHGAITNAGQPRWWFDFSMAEDLVVNAKPMFSFGRSAKVPAALLR